MGMKQKNVIPNDLAKLKAFIFYPYLSGNYLIVNCIDKQVAVRII